MARLRLKVVEPLMFRGPGEFDPTSRGVYSAAESTLMPSPSTVAGVLASLIVDQNFKPGDDWADDYSRALGGATIGLVALRLRGQLYFEDRLHGALLTPEAIRKYCGHAERLLESKSAEERRRAEQEIEKLVSDEIKKEEQAHGVPPALKIRRVGVGLKSRSAGLKLADEERGLLYTAEYVMYGEVGEAEIVADLHGYSGGPLDTAVRLGGEGRVARLIVEETDRTLEAELGLQDSNVAYVATPILFETGQAPIIDELRRVGLKVASAYGRAELVGAGYSLAKNRRKPIYRAIVPGSVLLLGEPVSPARLAFGLGTNIGYGRLLPISPEV